MSRRQSVTLLIAVVRIPLLCARAGQRGPHEIATRRECGAMAGAQAARPDDRLPLVHALQQRAIYVLLASAAEVTRRLMSQEENSPPTAARLPDVVVLDLCG